MSNWVSSLKRYCRTALVLPYRVALRLWWPVLALIDRRPDRKRVLVCVVNALTAQHLKRLIDLIRDDPRLAISMTVTTGAHDKRSLVVQLSLPYVSYFWARFRWWELIVYADHQGVDQFHPSVAKIFIQHGYDSGKVFQGQDYRYGPGWVLLANQEPKYTSMFETSYITRDKAIRACPSLAGHIAVVGDLGADMMLALNESREQIRQEMGFRPGDMVVLVMSTWGPQSMMESIGPAIIQQIKLLRDKFRFILSTHPRHWVGTYASKQPWGQRLLDLEGPGVVVARPDQDWERFAIACDVAVSDQTSLAVKFALLTKPLILLERATGLVLEETFGGRLYEALPHLDRPENLEREIERSLHAYPMEKLEQLACQINAHPGQAVPRMRRELCRVLSLPDATVEVT